MEADGKRRWFRLGCLLGLLMLLGALGLWFSSGTVRVELYRCLYPFVDDEQRGELSRRMRLVERRPDADWSARLSVAEDPDEVWDALVDAVYRSGPYEARGLEGEVAARLGSTEDEAQAALLVAVHGRLRDPRIDRRLGSFLGPDSALRILAAESLVLHGRRAEALSVVLSYLESARPAGGDLRSLGEDDINTVQALRILRRLGPEARTAVPELRRWARSDDPSERREARAALWVLDRDQKALKQLRRGFEDISAEGSETLSFLSLWSARLLVEIGQGDEDCRRVLERALAQPHRFSSRRCLETLALLGPKAGPSLPVLRSFLRHKDPAVAYAARQAITAIGGEEVP